MGGASCGEYRGGPDCRSGAGHGEERTENMPCMVVTLEVSKLSGWLNACAPENMWAIFVTLELSKISGWLNAFALLNMDCMSMTLDVSQLSRWLNTDALVNIDCMVVTPDVSKLSGWLNADASCRESNGGHTVRDDVRAGAREVAVSTAGHAACRGEGSTADWVQGTGRSARGTCSTCP